MSKATPSELAIFNSNAQFASVKPIGQLSVPNPERFYELLRDVRRTATFSGNGPMIERLESELCALHDVRHTIVFSNASIAIVALTHLLAEGKAGEVIMPAFTYSGLPHLVRWAGQMPRFADVEPTTHAISARTTEELINSRTTAILAVHQVNAPADIPGLTELSRRKGVPLFFDSVHGLYNTWQGKPIGSFGRAEVFSLHATKMLNGFEGGYVTTQDDRLDQQLRIVRNSGRDSSGIVQGLGIGGNLSEIHAAFVLAGIADLPDACARNQARYEAYRHGLSTVPELKVFEYPDGPDRLNYEFTLIEVDNGLPLTRDDLLEILVAENTRTRAYYSPPVHLSSHMPSGMDVPTLPVTESLAKKYLQMPMGELVSLEDIQQICSILKMTIENSEEIASMLRFRREVQP